MKGLLKCTTLILTLVLVFSSFPLLTQAEDADTGISVRAETKTEAFAPTNADKEDAALVSSSEDSITPRSNSSPNGAYRRPGSYYYQSEYYLENSNASWSGDYTYLTASDTVVDGVYAIESITEDLWGILNAFGTEEPVDPAFALQCGDFGIHPLDADNFFPYACFKITKKPGTNYYVIRWMNNHLYGVTGSGGTLSLKALSPNDANVALSDTFSIAYSTNGFVIKPYGYSTAISEPSDSYFGAELTLENPTTAGNRARWRLSRYTGYDIHGFTMYQNEDTFEDGVTTGSSVALKVAAFTTELYANETYVTLDSSTATKASLVWNSTTQTATVTGRDDTYATLQISSRNSSTNGIAYTFVRDFFVNLPIKEGVYTFKNGQLEKYMQIDDDTSSNNYMTAGAAIEVHDYNGNVYQRWEVLHAGDGYYRIVSELSGLALTVSSVNQSCNIVQKAYTGASSQQWMFSQKSNGNYVIRPRSAASYSTDWCLNTEYPFSGEINVKQASYTNDDSDRDEWILTNVAFYSLPLVELSDLTAGYFEDCFTAKGLQGYRGAAYQKNAFLRQLDEVSFMMFIGHGDSNLICIDSENDITLTTTDLAALPAGALSNIKFIALGSCLTGAGGASDPSNFANTLYSKGAQAVLSYKIEVDVRETNELMYQLAKYISYGHRIDKAREKAEIALSLSEAALPAGSTNSVLYPPNVYFLGDAYAELCDP